MCDFRRVGLVSWLLDRLLRARRSADPQDREILLLRRLSD
jgi:hypothetical protein